MSKEIREQIRRSLRLVQYLIEADYEPFMDELGNYVVYNKDGYRILINVKESPTHITLWHFKNKWKKVGVLTVSISEMRFSFDEDFKEYYRILEVNIEPEHRGLGFGKLMYDILIKLRGKNIKGLFSYLPNRSNKNQIPKIYKKYKSFTLGDYEIIKFE